MLRCNYSELVAVATVGSEHAGNECLDPAAPATPVHTPPPLLLSHKTPSLLLHVCLDLSMEWNEAFVYALAHSFLSVSPAPPVRWSSGRLLTLSLGMGGCLPAHHPTKIQSRLTPVKVEASQHTLHLSHHAGIISPQSTHDMDTLILLALSHVVMKSMQLCSHLASCRAGPARPILGCDQTLQTRHLNDVAHLDLWPCQCVDLLRERLEHRIEENRRRALLSILNELKHCR